MNDNFPYSFYCYKGQEYSLENVNNLSIIRQGDNREIVLHNDEFNKLNFDNLTNLQFSNLIRENIASPLDLYEIHPNLSQERLITRVVKENRVDLLQIIIEIAGARILNSCDINRVKALPPLAAVFENLNPSNRESLSKKVVMIEFLVRNQAEPNGLGIIRELTGGIVYKTPLQIGLEGVNPLELMINDGEDERRHFPDLYQYFIGLGADLHQNTCLEMRVCYSMLQNRMTLRSFKSAKTLNLLSNEEEVQPKNSILSKVIKTFRQIRKN